VERSFLVQRVQPAFGTFGGGVFHALPFLIPDYHVAIVVAVGGAVIAGLSSALGVAAG
jgi:hypothetical protein